MAAVTLKDLMDPLTKIQAATESTADSLDALTIAVARGGQSSGGAVQVQILKELQLQTRLMRKRQKNGEGGGLSSLFGGGKKKSSGFSENSNAFRLLGAGTAEMAKGLLLFMLVPKQTVTKFNDFVRAQIEMWADADTKKMEEGAAVMLAMGNSILKFSKSLALAALLLIPAAIGIPLLYLATALTVPLFLLLGMGEKQIKKGANALDAMGDAIKSFAIGLALFALTTFIILIQPSILLVMVASLVLMAGAILLIGKFSKPIKKGSFALAVMGVGLGIFALAYALFALTIAGAGVTLESLAIQAGVLIGIGVVTAILGALFSQIIQGAIALTVLGVGLIAFGIGYAIFAFTIAKTEPTMESILIQGAILLGIGLAATVLGALFSMIIQGAIAMVVMGVGLIAFGIGYAIFAMVIQKTAPTMESILIEGAILVGMGLAVAALGLGLPFIAMGTVSLILMAVGLAVFSLGYTPFADATRGSTQEDVDVQTGILTQLGIVFAAAGLLSLVIIPGAAAFAAIGGALQILAPGLMAIKDVKFTEKDSEDLATMLAGVKTAFIGNDGAQGGVSGFFSKLGGALTGAVDSVKMIAAAAGFAAAGGSLILLSKGLEAYKKLKWTPEDSLGLTAILVGVTGAFASAGGSKAESSGMFGALFGSAFAPSAVEKGINSVTNAGEALSSIAEGLLAFQIFVDKDIDFVKLGGDISKVVGFVQSAFGAIGGADQSVESGGFFSGLFGIKSTATEEGIRSVKDAGSALTGIAEGLLAFQELVDKDIDFVALGGDIEKVIGFVQTAFSAIGGGERVASGGFFSSLFGVDSTATEEGIRSVQGAGEVLKNIAEGLIGFQKLIDSKIVFGDPADPQPGTLAYAVINTIGFVQKAFAAIADSTVDGGWFSFDTNKVEQGVAAVSGAGQELKNISDALIAFDGLKDPTGTAEKVKTVLGLVGTAFASIGGTEETDSSWGISWDENLVEKGIEAVDGAGAALEDVATGLAAFAGEFDPVRVADAVALLLTSIGTAFSDLYKSNSRVSYQLRDFSTFISQLGAVARRGELDQAADGITRIAESINKIDVEKTVAFGDLFKSAAALSKDGKAYFALIKAIDDIKDLMQQQPNLIAQAVQYLSPAAEKEKIQKEQDRAGRGTQYLQLNKTLSSLSSAISDLPTTLASMELVVTDPNR